MTRAGVAVACAVMLLPAAAAAQKAAKGGVYERSVVEVAPAKKVPIKGVNIDNRLGNVRIEGHSGSKVIIEAIKRAGDRETLERLKVSLVSDPSGNVRIGTSIATGRELKPIPRGTARVDLVVRAPNSARAVGRIWNGKLVVIGMENGANLIANEGDIHVLKALGTISTQNAQGKQLFSQITGSIDAKGLIGDMDLAMIGGKRVSASVHHGNIVGRKIRVRELSLRSMKGNIVLHAHLIVGGKYRVSTYEGNIQVTFGNRVAMRVAARAPKGNVTLPPQLRPASQGTDGRVVATYESARAPAMLDLNANVGHIAFAF